VAAGVPESWWAPISASPRRDAPRSAALSSTGEECASTSDAHCRDESRCRLTNRLRASNTDASPAARTAFPQGPVKVLVSARLEAPSIDECPLDSQPLSRTSISNASPPPVFGFCRPESGFRRSFAASLRRGRWLDRDRYRTLFTLGRFWPRAARRLLQSKTICKHDLRTSKPGLARANSLSRIRLATPVRLRGPCLAIEAARLASNRFFLRCPVAITTISPPVLPDNDFNRMGAEDSRVRGRLVLGDPEITAPASLHDNRLSWRLRPNPIGSNTSCRAARADYDRSTVIESTSAPANVIERIRR